MVAEALQRDFDAPMLATAFPGWPVEAGFELRMENVDGIAGVAGMASLAE